MLKKILIRFNILYKLTAITTNNISNNSTFFKFIIEAIKRIYDNNDYILTLPLEITKSILPLITDVD